MWYLCRFESSIYYTNFFVFNPETYLCRFITDNFYNSSKHLLCETPNVNNRYGFSEFMKYKVLCDNEKISFLSWKIKDIDVYSYINIQGTYPRLVLEFKSNTVERVSIKHNYNALILSESEEWFCYTDIPYEMFKMFMFRSNKEYIKKLLHDCIIIKSITENGRYKALRSSIIYKSSKLIEGNFICG